MNATINGINITYPDLGFAFNPISILVEGFSDANYLIFKSGDFTIERDRYEYEGNTIRIELSGIARSLFNRSQFNKVEREDTTLYKTLAFDIINPSDQSTLYSGVIPIIWGALRIGETYTQSKTLTYFPGYPFTVPLLIQDTDVSIEASVDGGDFKQYEYLSASNTNKYNLDVSTLSPTRSVTLRTSKEVRRSIFDYTFDKTFRPQKITLKDDLNIRIEVDQCTKEGIYLRWINQYAEYNYYLFGSSDKSTVIKDNSLVLDSIFSTTNLTDNYHFGTGKTIGKDIETTTKIYAPLVDQDTFKLLLGLIKSPVVDMFVGYDKQGSAQWINISLQAGTFVETTNSLRDFECVLISNKQQIQSL